MDNITTEARNPRSEGLDRLSTPEILAHMNAEDATVPAAIARVLPQIAAAAEAIADSLADGGRLIYVGAGTSGRLGVLDAVECVPTFSVEPWQVVGIIAGGPPALTRSVEGAEDDVAAGERDLLALNPRPRDTVVGLAASGTTPYVLAALRTARRAGARTVGIACNAPSPLLELAELPIPLVVGAEVLTGSTRLKAGTAQKLVLNMLSTAAMVRIGKVYGNLMVDVRITNRKLAARAVRIVCQATGVNVTEAERLLGQTGQRVKSAIVMALLRVSAEEAQARLDAVNGRLRDALLDAPRPRASE